MNQCHPIDISSIYAPNNTIAQNEANENIEIYLSLSTEKLSDGQNNDTFCTTRLKLVNNRKIPADKYFIDNNTFF